MDDETVVFNKYNKARNAVKNQTGVEMAINIKILKLDCCTTLRNK